MDLETARADVTPNGKPLSLREYGRHRGVSAPSVMRAIRGGRLVRCLVIGAGGKPKIADVALADQEWDASTDLSKAPGYVKERAAGRKAPPAVSADEHGDEDEAQPVGQMTLGEASALEKEWRAKLAEQDYKRKAGELVNAAEVEARIVDAITQCKTKLLGLPSKAKVAIPELTHAQILVLDTIVREALEDLATLPPSTDGQVAA